LSVITEGQLSLVLSGGAANGNVVKSTGGQPSNTVVISTQINDVWLNIASASLVPGETIYRELYIRNSGPISWKNIKAWFSKPMTIAGAAISIAKSQKPPFTNVATGSDIQLVDDHTAPAGVTFSAPNSQATGLSLGPIPAGGYQGIFLKLVVDPNAITAPDECYTLRIQGDNSGGITPPSNTVQFGGGPILQNANVYLIYWGASYGVSGGSTPVSIYNVPIANSPTHLSSTSTDYQREGIVANTSTSVLLNKPPITEVDVCLGKSGSPTGNVTVNMRNSADGIIFQIGVIDAATGITQTAVKAYNLLCPTNTHAMVTGDYISIEYNGGNSTNYVTADNANDSVDGSNTCEFRYQGTTKSIRTTVDWCGQIFTGSSSTTGADKGFADSITAALKTLISSIYFSSLSQYSSIAPPTWKSSVVNTITPVPSGTFSKADCKQVCIDSITAGQVPAPTASNLYVVIGPAGKETSELVGGVVSSGDHGNFTYGAITDAHFVWIKNKTKIVDDATPSLSGEIIEAITDPDVEVIGQQGFFIADTSLCGGGSTNCEIVDPCANVVDRVSGIKVEAYYSDLDDACVIPGAGGSQTGGGIGPDGVKQLFTPNASGASFFLGTGNPNTIANLDAEGDTCTAGTQSNVSYWTIAGHGVHYSNGSTGRTVRLNISPTGSQNWNWKTGAISKGFIASPGDLNNHEMTIIFRPHSDLHIHTSFSWKPLGGIHTGSSDPRASCIELDVPYQPEHSAPQFARELNHPDYDYVTLNANFSAFVVDNVWMGVKMVTWKNADGVSRTNRLYLNMTPWNPDGTVNNNSWQLYSEYIDKQGVNTGSYTQFTSWAGGAPCTARIDGWDSIDFAKLSAFEIINPGT